MVKFFISITATFLTAATILTSNALAGPFGIDMGMSKSEFSNLESTGEPEMYKVYDVPKKHSAFEYYSVFIDEKYGVCKISGVGVDIRRDKTGHKIRDEFNSIKEILASKYGDSDDFNYLRRGALWDDYDEFMMALRQEERSLTSFWPSDNTNQELGDNIKSIMLKAYGLSSSDGYVRLVYEFSNLDKCLEDDLESNISAL